MLSAQAFLRRWVPTIQGPDRTVARARQTLLDRTPHPVAERIVRLRNSDEPLRQRRVRKRLDLPSIASLDLASIRRTDTLFILGSGSSISNLSRDHFDFIGEHDSLGFNFWLAHSFVPSIYLFYPGGHSTEDVFGRYRALMRRRSPDYENVPKIVTDLFSRNEEFIRSCPPEFLVKTHAAERWVAFARTVEELGSSLRRLDAKGAFGPHGPDEPMRRVFKYGASLSCALGLGLSMGYRKLVLCGIDLNDTAYFYDDPEQYPEMDGFSALYQPQDGGAHLTNRRGSLFMLTVSETVRAMRDELMIPRDIELSVQHSGSALHPDLPVFEADGWDVAAAGSS